uniref:Pipecolic acid and sarcosine oxidase n=1 Tax=Hucho hucho TaxID=62062 RepID=A0A4W5KCL4_9TELE
MSDQQDYNCIIIGAGIQGSFTAYHLAKNNKRTLLLEQGSSHGQTRIIRKAYEHDFYTHMMEECYLLWAKLEAEANVTLFRRTGILVKGPEDDVDFQQFRSILARNQVPTEILGPEEFSQRLPQVNLLAGEWALMDTTAGVLYANRALRAVQRVFQSEGGVIKDGDQVTDIQPGSTVTATTATEVYREESLVITAGPWANTLMALHWTTNTTTVVMINVCYWKEKVPGTLDISSRNPCFVQLGVEGSQYHFYGLPSNEYPGLMKICYHMGSETEPDESDQQTDRTDVHLLSQFVSHYLLGLEPEPAVVERVCTLSCCLQVTPDHHFVLDRHPHHNNIIIGAGFSGHGFKFGPVVGKVLCKLSLGQMPSYDLSPFKIQRL